MWFVRLLFYSQSSSDHPRYDLMGYGGAAIEVYRAVDAEPRSDAVRLDGKYYRI